MAVMAVPADDDATVLVSKPRPLLFEVTRWSDLAVAGTFPAAAVGDNGSPSVSESL